MHKAVPSFLFPEHSYSQNKRLPCGIWFQVSSRDGIPPRWHLKLHRAWFWSIVISVWGTVGISWAKAEAANTVRPSDIPQKVGLPHMPAVPLSRNTTPPPAPSLSVPGLWYTLGFFSSLEQLGLLPRSVLSFVGILKRGQVPAFAESVPAFCQVCLGLWVSFCVLGLERVSFKNPTQPYVLWFHQCDS